MLLTGADNRRMLVDGGVGPAYSQHVAPALGKLRDDGESIDVIYLSHIDDDHIGGILQLMNDEVAWRIHDFQVKNGNPNHKPPKVPRPPKVKAIWHNAFHDLLKDNTGKIEDMLAASAAILPGAEHLSGIEQKAVKELASAQAELVTSIAQSIKLTRRVSPEQLGIKLNQPAKGKLMLVRPASTAAIKVGGMSFRIIGPFQKDLDNLRKEWQEWLKKNQKQLKTIRAQAKKDESGFSAKEIDDIMLPKFAEAELLTELLPLDELATAVKLGDRKKVTTPNLASLMFLAEEAGKTLLLTGDGHHSDIVLGLKHLKKLNGTHKGIHVNVLKVQHHGSEHNLDEEFCRTVTADNYVFCGNGQHENPDVGVVQAIIDSRLGTASTLSPNPQVGDPFKFWFNCHASESPNAAARAHMKEIEKQVDKAVSKSHSQMSSFFLKGQSFDLAI